MLVNRSLNEFLRCHQRVANLDEQGSGVVEYVPLAVHKTNELAREPSTHALPGRWSLAAAGILAWLLLRLYNE